MVPWTAWRRSSCRSKQSEDVDEQHRTFVPERQREGATRGRRGRRARRDHRRTRDDGDARVPSTMLGIDVEPVTCGLKIESSNSAPWGCLCSVGRPLGGSLTVGAVAGLRALVLVRHGVGSSASVSRGRRPARPQHLAPRLRKARPMRAASIRPASTTMVGIADRRSRHHATHRQWPWATPLGRARRRDRARGRRRPSNLATSPRAPRPPRRASGSSTGPQAAARRARPSRRRSRRAPRGSARAGGRPRAQARCGTPVRSARSPALLAGGRVERTRDR